MADPESPELPAAYRHALVVGCTGMLADATTALGGRSETMTLVARTGSSLGRVGSVLSGQACVCHCLLLDWSQPGPFLDRIAEHVRRVGPPDLLLAWLHEDGLAPELAARACVPGHDCRFIHVRGSSTKDPTALPDPVPSMFAQLPGVTYQQVILGFVVREGSSRWLTPSEISAGTRQAIEAATPCMVVGVVTPWTRRP